MTREPEWDDTERNLMLALAQVEAETCSGCGYHSSLTDPSDPSNVFTPHERVCTVCAGSDVYTRVQHARDEEHEKGLGKKPDPKKPRPADGRSTHMRPVSPDEVNRQKAGPAADQA